MEDDLEEDPAPVDGVDRVEGDPELVEEGVTRGLFAHQGLDEVLADVEVAADGHHQHVVPDVAEHLERTQACLD